MDYEIEDDEKHRIIKLTPHGRLTKDDLWQGWNAVGMRLKDLGYKRVVLDMRDYTSGIPVIERYEAWTSLSKMYPAGTRIAGITSEGHPELETHEFMADTVTNHGFRCMLFTSEKDAVAWLAQEERDALEM